MHYLDDYVGFFNCFIDALKSMLFEHDLFLIDNDEDCDDEDDDHSSYFVIRKGDYHFEGATPEERGTLVIEPDCTYVKLSLSNSTDDEENDGMLLISNNINESYIRYYICCSDLGFINLSLLNAGDELRDCGKNELKRIVSLINAFM